MGYRIIGIIFLNRIWAVIANNDFFLDDIECINFFTYWDLMVFPGWWTNLNFGKKISVKIYKHRNLVRNKSVVDKIIYEIIM